MRKNATFTPHLNLTLLGRLLLFTGIFLVGSIMVMVTANPINAQSGDTQFKKISGEAFFKGTCQQVAIRPNGAFGHTVSNSVLLDEGFNPQASGMGFIVKRDCESGWETGNINGDYFMPGTPYEGWGLRVGNNRSTYNHNVNSTTGSLGEPGLNESSDEFEITWTHVQDGIKIEKLYRLPRTGELIFMDVTLTNETSETISDIFYGRGVDPDDDNWNTNLPGGTSVNPLGGNQYQSLNTVVTQYDPAETPYALVTAKFNDVSLLALFSSDERAVVARESSSFSQTFDPQAVWEGTGSFLTGIDSEGHLADAGMNLAIKVGELAAGESSSFTLNYMLSEDAVQQSVDAAASQVENITDTSGEFKATATENSTGYWIVIPQGESAPTAEQIKTGDDYSGVTVAAGGSSVMTADVEVTFSMTGLVQGTDYDVYFVAESDAEPGTFTSISKLSFTTLFKIIATAGVNGSIDPADQLVEKGSAAVFTITPEAGYLATVTGCGGTLTGDTYTTSEILAECSVEVSFMPGITLQGVEGFRMLSVPTTITYSDFLDPIWTQGAAGAKMAGGSPNVFTVDNSSFDGLRANWVGLTNLNTNIQAGTGFLVYVYEDDDPFVEEIIGGFPKTLSVSGTEFGDVSPTVNENNGGWTLLGNPYETSINFNSLAKTDLSGVVYVWDTTDNKGTDDPADSGSWKTYTVDGGIGELTDGLIAPFQGFFVQSGEGSPNVIFNNTAKSEENGQFVGKEGMEDNYVVRLELNGENLQSSAWLRFSEDGSIGSKGHGDALKLQSFSNNFAQLATQKSSGELLDINQLPIAEEGITIPVHITATRNGSYELTATDIKLPYDFDLTFHNSHTGESIPITNDFSYTIEVSGNAKKVNEIKPVEWLNDGPLKAKSEENTIYSITAVSSSIHTDAPGSNMPQSVSLDQNYPNPFNPTTQISYELPQQSQVQLAVYDMAGRMVASLVSGNVSAGVHTVNFDASSLSSGIYIYRLQAGNTQITRKLTLIK